MEVSSVAPTSTAVGSRIVAPRFAPKAHVRLETRTALGSLAWHAAVINNGVGLITADDDACSLAALRKLRTFYTANKAQHRYGNASVLTLEY